MKAQSISSLRAAVCAGAFAAWLPACLPDGTSPELPISTAGAGAVAGSAAGSGPAGSGGSTAGRAATAGTGAAGRAGAAGAAGRAMMPTGTAGGGAAGMMSMAGRMASGGAGAAGMAMAGRMAGGAGGTGGGGGAAGGGRGGMGGAAAGMGGAAAGMGGAAGGGNTTAATFTQVYGLIMAGCSCHVSGTSGGLAMPNKMTAYMNLVGANSTACAGQKRVVANNPNTSVLVHAIDRTKLGDCTPPAMPAGGMAKWSQADIDKVKSWVMAGAMNN